MTTLVNTETGEIVEPLERTEAERLTTRIRLRLDTIADNYAAVMPLIREAINRQAWQVLGYSGVSEYVSECFGDALSQLSTGVRREVVSELAASGMSTRAIAPVVGVHFTTVADDINAGVGVPTPDPAPTFVSATAALAEHEDDVDMEAESDIVASAELMEDAHVCTVHATEDSACAWDCVGKPYVSDADEQTEASVPAKVTGLDGKQYERKPAAPRRAPLPDSFWRTLHETRKKVESLHRLTEDDRWAKNAVEVAARNRHDLYRINDLLQQVINSLPENEVTA